VHMVTLDFVCISRFCERSPRIGDRHARFRLKGDQR
jgi:hypothetical protein